jgi:hypothetical protein
MRDPLLVAFRTLLILWVGAILAHFTYVQLVTDWGATAPDWNPANPWHPYYFGVVNATFVLVPFLLFQLPTARRYGGWSSSIGRAIITFGVGTVLWGFGNFFWFWKNVQGEDAPYPSLADAGYLAVLPFAAWSLWELSKVVGVRGRDWLWLPVALLVAFPLNAWIMLPERLLPGDLSGPEAGTFDTPLAAVISSTYVLSDVVLLAVAAIVAIGARRAAGGRFLAPVLAVTASIVLLYVGDLVFNYRIAKDTFYNAEVSDLLYGAFIVLSSYAVYLFLAADVRATAATQLAEQRRAQRIDGDDEDDVVDSQLPLLVALPTAILRSQERVMGAQSARAVCAGVRGITVDGGVARAADLADVDALVAAYRSLAGPLGEMTCWTAARSVLVAHPEVRIPAFARFQ